MQEDLFIKGFSSSAAFVEFISSSLATSVGVVG